MECNAKSVSVRSLCSKVLTLLDRGLFIQEALAKVQSEYFRNFSDQHLLSELAYGVVRSEIRLNFILESVTKMASLPKKVQYILLIATYSLLYLDRIPIHAIFFEAIEETKKLFGRRLANFVCAVLHKLAMHKDLFSELAFYRDVHDEPQSSSLHALSRYYSLPFWLAKFWEDQYGLTASIHLMRRSAQRPKACFRLNQKHNERDLKIFLLDQGAQFITDSAFFLPKAQPGLLNRLQASGSISAQSLGSQLLLHNLGLAHWKKPVWDFCAGFGGKSAWLSEQGVPIFLATDFSWNRLVGLIKDFQRRHDQLPFCLQMDGTIPAVKSFAGNLIVDVPCSGLGILARRPDLRRVRKTKRSLRLFPKTQRALLLSALQYLTPHCELAYLTCTVNPAENEMIVSEILRIHPELTLERCWQTPHDLEDVEGMYGAVLRRRY
ncbi:MAG: hypothetical protein IK079_02670 [Desulfovibrio sp.]|nr:hypothetical protein [Desulfovibrio sp.]